MQATHSLYSTSTENPGFTKSNKDIEYQILSRITKRMKRLAAGSGASERDIIDVVFENRKLWNLFAADLLSPGNSYPDELKAKLVFLSKFVVQHSQKVLSHNESIGPLVDINLAILRGLSSIEVSK